MQANICYCLSQNVILNLHVLLITWGKFYFIIMIEKLQNALLFIFKETNVYVNIRTNYKLPKYF